MKHRLFVNKLTSVGLVDAGDNPAADVLIFKTADVEKRQVGSDERDRLARRGFALPDGSFPIETVADLRNAVQAFGRAANQPAARRHIIRRARALGRTDLLPDGWDVSKMDETRRVTAPKPKGATVDLEKIPEGLRDEIAALQKDRDAQAEQAVELAGKVEDLTRQLDELTAPPEPDPLEKADPVVKAQLEAQAAKIEELEKAADVAAAEARLEKAQVEHTELMLTEASAADVAQIVAVAPEAWERVRQDMVRKNAVIEQSDLLKELGRTGDGEPESAVAQVTHRAVELRKDKPELTLAQAKVAVRDADPELKAAELKETRGS